MRIALNKTNTIQKLPLSYYIIIQNEDKRIDTLRII